MEWRARYFREVELISANERFCISVHRVRGSYFARVAELPGCITRGASEVEAVENARIAIRLYRAIAREMEHDAATVRVQIRA